MVLVNSTKSIHVPSFQNPHALNIIATNYYNVELQYCDFAYFILMEPITNLNRQSRISI